MGLAREACQWGGCRVCSLGQECQHCALGVGGWNSLGPQQGLLPWASGPHPFSVKRHSGPPIQGTPSWGEAVLSWFGKLQATLWGPLGREAGSPTCEA